MEEQSKMAKTTLDVVGKGYRSIGLTHSCPCCGGGNTYFSCYESALVCFSCGEVFDTPEGVVSIVPHRTRQFEQPSQASAVEEDFADLRARLGR